MEKSKAGNSIVEYNVLIAILRILLVCNLVSYNDGFYFSEQNLKDFNSIIDSIYSNSYILNYANEVYTKYISLEKPFFEEITDLELEIYSRCNFGVSYEIGKKLISIIDFSNSSILELGGNSGGLSTAIAQTYYTSNITIVDSKIPCFVGNEFKEINSLNNVSFIEADFLKNISTDNKNKDFVIASNVLHDFDDKNCLKILNNMKKYCSYKTKILLIEDFLSSDCAPENVILHGLRLSVNTKTGRQRTYIEIEKLLETIDYEITSSLKISEIISLVIAEWKWSK